MELRRDGDGERIPIVGCPLLAVTPESLAWIRWHGLWQRGLFPVAGGVMDQPAKYLSAMEHLDLVTAKQERPDHSDRR
jgi:hypothetical protein